MELYFCLNIILCLITSILLIYNLYRKRFLLIKPSIILLIFYHVQIQISGSLLSMETYNYLPKPYEFMILLHGFPLIGLIGSLLFSLKKAEHTYNRVINVEIKFNISIVGSLLLIITTILIIYLRYIPFNQTGLYAILFQPEKSAIARENSLKLLDSVFVRYAFTFLKNVFAPLLFTYLLFWGYKHFKNKSLIKVSLITILLSYISFAVLLPGARSTLAFLILGFFYAFYLKKGAPIKLKYFATSFLIVVSVPVILSILREGKNLTLSLFFKYLSTGIFNRIFVVPFDTGLWHAHYAQIHGFIGISGIPKLATLYGVDSINVPMLIYQLYSPYAHVIDSGFANTSYVFSYYSFFGLSSLILSLIALWILDIVIIVYNMISDRLLIPTISAMFIAIISLVSIDYTTALLTGGILIIPVVALFLDNLGRINFTPRLGVKKLKQIG